MLKERKVERDKDRQKFMEGQEKWKGHKYIEKKNELHSVYHFLSSTSNVFILLLQGELEVEEVDIHCGAVMSPTKNAISQIEKEVINYLFFIQKQTKTIENKHKY